MGYVKFLSVTAVALKLVASTFAATATDWRSQSIYQVITDRFARTDYALTDYCNPNDRAYCGGTWVGIINNLDYIQSMGFTAVWISPVTYNLPGSTADGEAYHGYWQQNLYELNPNFGTAGDLKALSEALHKRGMFLMVDVVVNHFGYNGAGDTVDYTQLHPFNKENYYHPYCLISNYSDQDNVEDCWLGDTQVSLPDLATEESLVTEIYYSWIHDLVANYSIDGLRIDTVKHVDKAFWAGFNSAAGVFCTGESLNYDASYTCAYQNYLDSVLNYPMYGPLVQAFSSEHGDMSGLVDAINTIKGVCKDSTILGAFSENHDVPRFASFTTDMSLAMNTIAFTMLADGVPIIYQGQEAHLAGSGDPANREAIWKTGFRTDLPLHNFISLMNQIRRQAIEMDKNYLIYKNYPVYSNGHVIAMRKGFDGYQVITVLTNAGTSDAEYTFALGGTGFQPGTVLVEVTKCLTVSISGDGSLDVAMAQGLPKVFYPAAQLSGSGICSL
ncbi:MAG: hypothetical protein M1812_006659 [Candelaria pacifica]|nr:MAG: hypothetical protein M1812_006659 [Candelaria pacifica]